VAFAAPKAAADRIHETVVSLLTITSTLTDRVIVSRLQIVSPKRRFTLAAMEAGMANRARGLIETGRDL
jgi:hypothetical protein